MILEGNVSFLRLAITDLHDAVTAELAGMRIAGEIHRLQMAQLVKPQPFSWVS